MRKMKKFNHGGPGPPVPWSFAEKKAISGYFFSLILLFPPGNSVKLRGFFLKQITIPELWGKFGGKEWG
jgi:hypothetical protein